MLIFFDETPLDPEALGQTAPSAPPFRWLCTQYRCNDNDDDDISEDSYDYDDDDFIEKRGGQE